MKKGIVVGLIATYALPLSFAFAQAPVFGGAKNFIDTAIELVNDLVILLAALALLVFFWGMVKFIMKAGDTKAQAEGRSLMVWGVIAMFVMATLWGIISFIQGELGLDPNQTVVVPQINP